MSLSKILMEKNILQRLNFLYRIQQDKLSFDEIVDFLYGEKPPADSNYLAYNYAPSIEKILKFNENCAPSKILFSVIIPTYRRPKLLTETLNALAKQTGIAPRTFEIVMVDDGSQDIATEKVVATFAKKMRQRIVFVALRGNHGPEFARNVGVLHSQGDFLAFTDDDCIVPPNLLSLFAEDFKKNPKLAGTGGWKEPHAPDGKLDIYHRFLFWTHRFYPEKPKEGFYFSRSGYTANVCFQRDAFEKTGGFNFYFQHVGFHDFAIRMFLAERSVAYEPRMVYHHASFSFSDVYRKCLVLGWDYYLLHVLYPSRWKNVTLYASLKRIARYTRAFFQGETKEIFPKKSFSDIFWFFLLSVVTSFCMWFGKYWMVFRAADNLSDGKSRTRLMK